MKIKQAEVELRLTQAEAGRLNTQIKTNKIKY